MYACMNEFCADYDIPETYNNIEGILMIIVTKST